MDDNIKTPQDALEWLDRSIREEAELDGEMSNAHAIQLGFIQNMLAKFPRRNCDRFATVDEARKAHEEYRRDYIMCASNKFDFPMEFEAWLFATATEKEGGANG